MKNVLKFGLMAIAACSILFTACKKDDKSAADIMTTGSWKTTKDESKLTTETTWTANAIDACTADDFTTYAKSGSFTFDEGATKCDPTDDQSTTGTWALSSDEKTLTLTDSGFGIAFTVESISESKIVLSVADFFGTGEDQRITMEPK